MPYDSYKNDQDMYDVHGTSWKVRGLLSAGATPNFFAAQTKFPDAVGYYLAAQGIGGLGGLALTQPQIMALYEAEVCYADLLWKGDRYPLDSLSLPNYANGCQSRSHIILSQGGNFKQKMPRLVAHNLIEGQGSCVYADGVNTTGGTEWTIDHAGWLTSRFTERNMIQGTMYGSSVNSGVYQEGFMIAQQSLNGGRRGQVYTNTFVSHGCAFSQTGSVSVFRDLKVDGFNNAGIMIDGGIPARIENCRMFMNNQAGIILKGTSLSSLTIDGVEFDDNPVCILLQNGTTSPVQPPGGKPIEIRSIKSENGKNLVGGAVRPQEIAHLYGAYAVKIDGVGAAVYAGRVPYAFRFDNLKTGGGRFNSYVEVNNFYENGSGVGCGFDYMFTDGLRKWPMPPASVPHSFSVRLNANGTTNVVTSWSATGSLAPVAYP